MDKKKSLFCSLLGTVTTAFAIGVFLTPNKIVGGGASGLGTIFYYALNIPPGLSFFMINVIFLLISFKTLGKSFVLKTLVSVTILSVLVQVFSLIPIYTDNLILAAVFGGGVYGAGIGLNFAAGASTGGTDIIGRLVQIKFPSVPIGKLLMFVDGIIILSSLLVFKKVELILYGIISLIVSSYMIDFVIKKLNVSRLVFVITDKGDEISKRLVSSSPRGVTLIDVKGVYTSSEKKMLFCALKEKEAVEFQKKILTIDNKAFIVFSEAQRIKGNGFHLYK